ncbi:hypothetical protein C1645_835028 [Glomus cerebriforme]|uniref:Protein kinase domain-containing protein n=1 Tax=Glomus cerebriforme TaxID=658196 RepID=A0A397SD84_9GLOM|nr:hypothetical protein C1645_835028 [Glomus cerebriforme]
MIRKIYLDNVVALKSLKNSSLNNDSFIKEIVNELKLLRVNLHPNITQCFGITKQNSGTLRNYLKDNFSKLDWNIKLQFAIQIADRVSFHQNMIRIKDFGLSRRMAEVSRSKKNFGMVPYIDPQLLK